MRVWASAADVRSFQLTIGSTKVSHYPLGENNQQGVVNLVEAGKGLRYLPCQMSGFAGGWFLGSISEGTIAQQR